MSPTRRSTKRLKTSTEKVIEKVTKATETTTTSPTRKTKSPTTTKTKTSKKEEKKEEITKNAWNQLFKTKSTSSSSSSKTLIVRTNKKNENDGPILDSKIQQAIDNHPRFSQISEKKQAKNHKIIAWNVNGLRACLKKEDGIYFKAYIAQEDPDIFCISETKICHEELAKLEDCLPQYEFQYWSCAEKKGYAGTAIFSKVKPLSVQHEIVPESKPDNEGRFIALEYEKYWLVHTYVPNAGMKLDRLDYRTQKWDVAMLKQLKQLELTKPVIWCGDLNVAHQEIDIHDPKSNKNKSPGFTDAERESFGNMLENGFVDTFRQLNPDKKQFTYWSYRFNARQKNKGWRLDYFILSKALFKQVETTYVRDEILGSDHVPIGLELKME